MLTALSGGVPDRLPITIHQWQGYHLREHMGGLDVLDAFEAVGLDAAHTPWDVVETIPSPDWRSSVAELGEEDGTRYRRVTIETPRGQLTQVTGQDCYTTYVKEHLIKGPRDLELLLQYAPLAKLNHARLTQHYDRVGDRGIVRGFICWMAQPGPWQEFCELVGTEQAILWAIDDPATVHHFLEQMTQRKVRYVHEQMPGARYDLIEHGGGAASCNVISPTMFDEFCVPYDRRIIGALHEYGFKVAYHTCGHMMANLERIPANGCDASETLSPPGVGGDIASREQRLRVKQVLGSKVRLIGGVDQSRLDQPESPENSQAIARDVRECFETFGQGGGYICSAADHFFHAPANNLRVMAQEAHRCCY
jgi:hypothetical protein